MRNILAEYAYSLKERLTDEENWEKIYEHAKISCAGVLAVESGGLLGYTTYNTFLESVENSITLSLVYGSVAFLLGMGKLSKYISKRRANERLRLLENM